ncbi:MAG: hypothetical protein ACYS7Y_34045 [Planctomycetota bacterium]|jgi:hypothetical protein
MKEIVQQILRYLPRYIPVFLQVISRPGSAIQERNQNRPEDLREALIFCAISFFLIFPFQRALIPSQLELWMHIAQSVALAFFMGLSSAALIRLALWIVGVRSTPLESVLVVYCYVMGVLLIIFMFSCLIALGAFKTLYPDSYKSAMTIWYSPDSIPFHPKIEKELQQLPGYLLYSVVLSLLCSLSAIWFAAAWKAFRQVTGLTKRRSIVAVILSFIFLFPVMLSVFFIRRLFM